MVVKHHHHNNKNLLVMVLIYLVVCTVPYFSLIPPINWGVSVGSQQQEPPVAVPLLPPQVETYHKPTPHPTIAPIPTQTIPSEPLPPPAPDYFKT